MLCYCGRDIKEGSKNVISTFKGNSIRVLNVPIFQCEIGHTTIPRRHRIRMREIARVAYCNQESEIEFNIK